MPTAARLVIKRVLSTSSKLSGEGELRQSTLRSRKPTPKLRELAGGTAFESALRDSTQAEQVGAP
ncbi:MAG: hypothetical protein ACE5H2_02065 [Terriglobia bacterium]